MTEEVNLVQRKEPMLPINFYIYAEFREAGSKDIFSI